MRSMVVFAKCRRNVNNPGSSVQRDEILGYDSPTKWLLAAGLERQLCLTQSVEIEIERGLIAKTH